MGRYTLHSKLAAGGTATVYFGRMTGAAGFTRTVAIKRLHPHLADEPEFVSMMTDEARLAARVQHPNVVQTLDVVSTGHELLIVMEYVAGESLARLMRAESKRQRQVPVPIVSAVINGVLHGLHAAHEAKSDRGVPLGIVHRDVSPQNVLVGVDGLARVIDFGVAKAKGRLQTTREGVVKGKLAYMAPEQLSGQVVTRLADVYAAGVVLWEMLTGRRLFKAEDDGALFGQVLNGARDRPSRWVAGLPLGIDALVMRAIARDPNERFATAREMADALVRVVPPALGAEVGAWVEDTAKTVLDERAEQLAEIESSSSVSIRPPAQTNAVAEAKAPQPVAPPPQGSTSKPGEETRDAPIPLPQGPAPNLGKATCEAPPIPPPEAASQARATPGLAPAIPPPRDSARKLAQETGEPPAIPPPQGLPPTPADQAGDSPTTTPSQLSSIAVEMPERWLPRRLPALQAKTWVALGAVVLLVGVGVTMLAQHGGSEPAASAPVASAPAVEPPAPSAGSAASSTPTPTVAPVAPPPSVAIESPAPTPVASASASGPVATAPAPAAQAAEPRPPRPATPAPATPARPAKPGRTPRPAGTVVFDNPD